MNTELIIGSETYNLRLTTRNCVALERALGYNPLQLFYDLDNDRLPKMGDMIIVLHSMLQSYQHNISMDKVYDLFDVYVSEGHTMFDLIPLFIDVFKSCGFVGKETSNEVEEKNS